MLPLTGSVRLKSPICPLGALAKHGSSPLFHGPIAGSWPMASLFACLVVVVVVGTIDRPRDVDQREVKNRNSSAVRELVASGEPHRIDSFLVFSFVGARFYSR